MWRSIAISVVLMLPIAAAAAVPDQPAACRFLGEPAPTAAQRARLAQLNIDINSLPNHGDYRPLWERLRQLAGEPCYRALLNLAPLPECRSALAMRDWWETGGYAWFGSAATDTPGSRSIELPPGMRATLDLEGNGRHRLASLLCHIGDSSCGRETQGWLQRADEAILRNNAVARRSMRGPYPTEVCQKPSGANAPARYAAWRDCIEKERRKRDFNRRLPAGWFQAPTAGWLVVRGRRGHYTFTDELAAFDLTTGAAFRAWQHGDLGIGPPKDAEAIERRRTGLGKVAVERGRVPIDNLREAALIMFLWPERQRQLMTASVELPADVDVVSLPKGFAHPNWDEVIHGTSGDTTLSWDWVRPGGKAVVSGTSTYTGSWADGGTPTWLLEIAEAGLQPGCPPAPLPPGLVERGGPIGGVSSIDALPEELDQVEVALVAALTESNAACARPMPTPTPTLKPTGKAKTKAGTTPP